MKIGTEMVTVPIGSFDPIKQVEVRVERTEDKVLCKVDEVPGLSVADYEGTFGSMSWSPEHLDHTAQYHAERHVYTYLGIALA